MNVQPKQQYKCSKCDKPYHKKVALTTHIKKAHNISYNSTKKDIMEISTNNTSESNNKNIEVDNLEMKHAKEQEQVDNQNKPKIMFAMKITVNFNTSI